MRTGLCGLVMTSALIAARDGVCPDRASLRSRVPAGDRRRLPRGARRARPGESAAGAEREVHRAGSGPQGGRRPVADHHRGADDIQDPGARSGRRTDQGNPDDQGERAGAGGSSGGPPVPPGPYAVQLALRLKVENRRIAEAEHIYATIIDPGRSPTCRPCARRCSRTCRRRSGVRVI